MSKRFVNREKKVLSELGFRRQAASGAHWIWKEDGESEDYVAQVKSTDGKSIKVDRQIIKDLYYHAAIAHKKPVLILDFVGGETLVAFSADDAKEFLQ